MSFSLKGYERKLLQFGKRMSFAKNDVKNIPLKFYFFTSNPLLKSRMLVLPLLTNTCSLLSFFLSSVAT